MFGTYNLVVPITASEYLIFNTLSKALITVNKSELAALRKGDLSSSALRRALIVCGEADEAMALERYTAAAVSRNELHLTIMLTRKCNFDCIYCFQQGDAEDMSIEVTQELMLWIRRQIDTNSYDAVSLVFYGGEPLLMIDTLVGIANGIRAFVGARKLYMSVITNGWFLTPDVVEELTRSGVTAVHATLDGPAEIHDARRPLRGGGATYDRILANISYASQFVDLTIRVNWDNNTISLISSMFEGISQYCPQPAKIHIDFCPVFGLNSGVITDIEPQSVYSTRKLWLAAREARESGFSLCNPFRRLPCRVRHHSSFTASTKGVLYKCNLMAEDQKYAFTNFKVRLPLHGEVDLSTSHRGCPYYPICLGGCEHAKQCDAQQGCRRIEYDILRDAILPHCLRSV